MSTLNVFISRDAAFVVNDGAAYRAQDDVLQGVVQKSLPIVHACTVLAARGPIAFLPLLFLEVNGRSCRTFDDVTDNFAEACRAVFNASRELLEKAGDTKVEAIAAGYSIRKRHASACVVTNGDDAETWSSTTVEPGCIHLGPCDDRLLDRLAAARIPAPDSSDFVPDSDLLRIAREQRKLSWNGEATCGAHVVLDVVSRVGVSSHVLERWPDRVGEPIAA